AGVEEAGGDQAPVLRLDGDREGVEAALVEEAVLAAGALVGLGFVAAERRSIPAIGWGVCAAVGLGSVVAAIAVADEPIVRTVAIEWLDPVFVAGHWTPQLIEMAGGDDPLGLPGEPSPQLDWETVAATQPEVVVVMPCGFDAARSLELAEAFEAQLRATGARKIACVDGSATFSRPGPRLVDGLENLAHILHPNAVPQAPGPILEL
ncbi:MAG: hypothetical protein ACKOTH_02785, partial [Solirubrobacterales bacterium]